ncbi:MAG TPA: isoprenylcysteine carboxylmethyltransferase family protein [Pseudolabrys sp.]|nr:isoprenylcysteine carboxylmethyltransferase family protein [Pseudolabrys sp.]
MTTRTQVEDVLGRSLLVGIFSLLAALQITSIADLWRAPGGFDSAATIIISKAFALIFVLTTVFLTVKRLPPKGSATGIEPRATAIAGTFILMVLAAVPVGRITPPVHLLAAVLIVTGTLFSIFCLFWLGRSFSVMATARRLVVRGPYAFVRHPLYVAEAVTTVGIILSNWSAAALVIGMAWCVLQYRRSINEEAVLRATFPEYDEYARRVPRFIPDLKMPLWNVVASATGPSDGLNPDR